MDAVGDLFALRLHIDNHVHVGTVQARLCTGVSDLLAHLASYLVKVNLAFIYADLTQKHELKSKSSVEHLTIPDLVAVSMATLASGLIRMQASRIPSLT